MKRYTPFSACWEVLRHYILHYSVWLDYRISWLEWIFNISRLYILYAHVYDSGPQGIDFIHRGVLLLTRMGPVCIQNQALVITAFSRRFFAYQWFHVNVAEEIWQTSRHFQCYHISYREIFYNIRNIGQMQRMNMSMSFPNWSLQRRHLRIMRLIWLLARLIWLVDSSFRLMMTSSNGNIFRVTGHLFGEFTGLRWISHTKASDAELLCFLWSAPE